MTSLKLARVSVQLGGRVVLDTVDLAVEPGEIVGIIGPNGAGKSTLLKSALGLVPYTGAIELNDQDRAALDVTQSARLVAYVPQDHEIAWPMTVEGLVGLGRHPYRAPFAATSREDRHAVENALREMDVTDLRHRQTSELSGGEKARALIARALAQQTPLLLADEPTAGLDPAHQLRLLRLLRSKAQSGQAIVLTIHELHVAARWCDRLVLLDRGRLVAEGAPRSVLTPKLLAEVYGCEAYLADDASGLIVVPTRLVADDGPSQS